jgi:hypothetical protein
MQVWSLLLTLLPIDQAEEDASQAAEQSKSIERRTGRTQKDG